MNLVHTLAFSPFVTVQSDSAAKTWSLSPESQLAIGVIAGITALTIYFAVRGRSVRANLDVKELGALDWSTDSGAQAALEAIKGYALALGESGVKWYADAKPSDKRFALWVRILVVFFSSVAALVPVLSEWTNNAISPLLSTVALGIAATLFSLDRYFGFSKAWIRYTQAQTRIQSLMTRFHFEWESERACTTVSSQPCAKLQTLVAIASKYVADLRKVIEDETSAWVDDFRQSFSDLESKLKDQADADTLRAKERSDDRQRGRDDARTGVVPIVVTNGASVGEGWLLVVDGQQRERRTGERVFERLVAGLRIVRVEGTIQGVVRRAEGAAQVEPDQIMPELRLTLS
ncbi:MAG: SLATT domain-containing protein [Planctomycetota bacterium]